MLRTDGRIVAKLRLFHDGQFLQRTRVTAQQDAVCAVNILAADGDDAARDSAEYFQQRDRLPFTAKNEVHHNVEVQALQFTTMPNEFVAVPKHRSYLWRERSFGIAAM